jgi:hypothetical protein
MIKCGNKNALTSVEFCSAKQSIVKNRNGYHIIYTIFFIKHADSISES